MNKLKVSKFTKQYYCEVPTVPINGWLTIVYWIHLSDNRNVQAFGCPVSTELLYYYVHT